MKPKIHPKYGKSIVKCACGSSFETGSVKPELLTEICSSCHPLYTGTKKIVDSMKRVDKFMKKMEKKEKLAAEKTKRIAAKKAKAEPKAETAKNTASKTKAEKK